MMDRFKIINKNVMLDNNSIYKIVYSISLSDKEIYYLINVGDFSDIKFCYMYGENEFEEIRDKEELKAITKELCKNVNLFIR